MVLERTDEAPSLAVALSSTADLMKDHIDAAVTYGVDCGARLELTTVLSHFPELELELELLGSEYNADLTKDEMEVLWSDSSDISLPSLFFVLSFSYKLWD
jgi:hypothetical protein